MKKVVILGISGVLLGAGLVGAQGSLSGGAGTQDGQTRTTDAATESVTDTQTDTRQGAMLARLLLGRPLTMGSTLSVTFYDGDPEADGGELRSLEFVYGEDSEAAFAEQLEAAAAEASHVTVTTSPQTAPYNLDEANMALPDGFRPGGFGPDEHGPDRGFGGSRGDPDGHAH